MTTSIQGAPVECDLCLADHIKKLRIANQRLEDFAHIASHDLRSPLRAMMSLAEWVRDDIESTFGELPDQVDADLAEIVKQGRRMGKLLQDLLEFSQVGNSGSKERPFDPKAVVLDCLDVCALSDDFSVTVADALPAVRCNQVEFALAIRNLVTNGVKHHDRTKGQIVVDGWEENGFGFFRVRDDGPGVDPKNAETIFELFKTFDSSRGSGIGLGLVRKIANEYGGIAKVVSNPLGRGSDFIFSLPLANQPACTGHLANRCP